MKNKSKSDQTSTGEKTIEDQRSWIKKRTPYGLFKLSDATHEILDKTSAKTDEATMYIYDEISYWGIDAKYFVQELNSIDKKTINIRINSPGGWIHDGITIYNALKQHPAEIVVYIDGLAASIASVIAMAGDEIKMSKSSQFVIHDPWTGVVGSAKDLRKEADILDQSKDILIDLYHDQGNQDKTVISDWMDEETWFVAKDALEVGFITSIYDESPKESNSILFDLGLFNRVPDEDTQSKELTIRDCEKALRDAGCSQDRAKAILSAGFSPKQRDVVMDDSESQRDVGESVAIPDPKDRMSQLEIKKIRLLSGSDGN